MSRYIDADKLQEVFKELHGGKRSLLIDIQPTADAVEVVRCKDCRYMTEHYDVDGNAPYWTCSEWDSGTDYDGFCSYGERKEQ